MITLANWIVGLMSLYLICGLLFAVPFVVRGVNRIDKLAGRSSWGFRVIIVPGVVVLWPLLFWRWYAEAEPPAEHNSHRDAAGRSR